MSQRCIVGLTIGRLMEHGDMIFSKSGEFLNGWEGSTKAVDITHIAYDVDAALAPAPKCLKVDPGYCPDPGVLRRLRFKPGTKLQSGNVGGPQISKPRE